MVLEMSLEGTRGWCVECLAHCAGELGFDSVGNEGFK